MQTIKLTMSQHACERLQERAGIKASTKAPFVLSGYQVISRSNVEAKLVYANLVFVVSVPDNHVLTVYFKPYPKNQ
jgi:hypothetical protein